MPLLNEQLTFRQVTSSFLSGYSGPGAPKAIQPKKRSFAEADAAPWDEGLVDWPLLQFDLATEAMGEDCEGFVDGCDNEGFCDEKVPDEYAEPAMATLRKVYSTVSDWVEVVRVTHTPKKGLWCKPPCRVQWVSPSTGAKLCYIQSRTMNCCALEHESTGLATGDRNAHPFIYHSNFRYDNSDGSATVTEIPGGEITPEAVLIK